jgi:hypothetical protein
MFDIYKSNNLFVYSIHHLFTLFQTFKKVLAQLFFYLTYLLIFFIITIIIFNIIIIDFHLI